MNLIQRTLATLGLATALVSCGAAADAVRYQHGGLTYIVQHETGMSVPDMSLVRTESRAVGFAEEGRLPPGYAVTGYLNADGTTYEEGSDSPRYDAFVRIADVDGDGDADLMHLVVNTQITRSPSVQEVGRSLHNQVILQDADFDGNADRVWVDGRMDGTYERLQMLENRPMQPLIDNLLKYPRYTPPTRTTQPTSNPTDTSSYHVDQSGDL